MRREIRSFVKRNGRITPGQKKYVSLYLEQYEVSLNSECLFSQSFGNKNPVIIDIGFGNGDDLFSQAYNNPQYNFIGIEVYLSGIGVLLKKITENSLVNLRIINGDAVEVLNNNILRNSVSKIQLLFPDPWPKKKHHKRRIIQLEFVNNIYEVLCSEGFLHIVTDCEKYAEYIADVIKKSNKFVDEFSINNHGMNFKRETTRFEKKGLNKGSIIREFSFVKK